MWHWLIDLVLVALLILFLIDKLTFLWVRRCYDLFYRLVILFKGYLIFIDIDDFGGFNKKYSHKMGDRILRKLGGIVQKWSGLRGFRYGGDEFAILLLCVNKEKAIKLAEKVRSRIEKTNIEGLGVTVSCVVVQREEEASEFLKEAKKNGKNQVVIND